MPYDRQAAVAYAHQWAYSRNKRYLSFDGIGGDCTNFISQCLYAGGAPMNHKKTFGWYYSTPADRAPAWTGVEYLYNFLAKNKESGPFAREIGVEELDFGDIIQLSFHVGMFSHSLLVVDPGRLPGSGDILVATHSMDSDYRPLSTYQTVATRYLKIDVR